MNAEQYLESLKKGIVSTGSGGLMAPEDADYFIALVEKENAFLGRIGVETMSKETKRIDTLGLDSRVLRAGVEGEAPSEVVGIKTGRRTLEAKEVILPYDITYDWLEENIEREGAEEKVNSLFATQFGNDLLDLAINGDEDLAETITDTSPADGYDDTTGLSQNDHTFLRLNNGWLKIMANDDDTHAVTYAAENADDFLGTIFPAMLAAMPNKWKADPTQLAFLVSGSDAHKYRMQLAGRETGLGDASILERKTLYYAGIEVIPVPFWPDGKPVLTRQKNLKVGIRRDMRSERQVQSRKRLVEYTITGKVDANYAVSDMIVYATQTT